MNHLTAAGGRCLDEAQRRSRQPDDNHVGTEHIVLGVLTGDPGIAGILARHGITEEVFRGQLFQEPGRWVLRRSRAVAGLVEGVSPSGSCPHRLSWPGRNQLSRLYRQMT